MTSSPSFHPSLPLICLFCLFLLRWLNTLHTSKLGVKKMRAGLFFFSDLYSPCPLSKHLLLPGFSRVPSLTISSEACF